MNLRSNILPLCHPTRAAFTLVELLTVIAIIGILAGILVPVVGKVRNRARQSVCTTHLRQIGIGLQMYANDNKDRFPPVVDTSINGSSDWTKTGWYPQLIRPYLDNPNVWNCPAQPYDRHLGSASTITTDQAWRTQKTWYLPSYSINSVIAGKLRSVVLDTPNAIKQIFLTEGQANFWDSGSISSGNYVQEPHASPNTNTLLFIDGHVELGAKADMVAYTTGGGSTYRIITLKRYKP